jgi:hypothetical protein
VIPRIKQPLEKINIYSYLKENNSNNNIMTLITQKQQCPDWSRCARLADYNHKEQFYHPCKHGSTCRMLSDEIHRNRFQHPCSLNTTCSQRTDTLHCIQFTHSLVSQIIPIEQQQQIQPIPQSPTKKTRIDDKKPCPDWNTCTQQNDKFHKQEYYHMCSKNTNCTLVSDVVHRSRYLHSCLYGPHCAQLQDEDHCIHFIHDASLKSCRSLTIPENKTLPYCPDFNDCRKTNDEQHRSMFRHQCKDGDNCASLNNPVHILRFVHPCKFAERCHKQYDDLDHRKNFTHPCQYGVGCRYMLAHDIAHILQFIHPTADNTASVLKFQWPSHWQNPSAPDPSILDTKTNYSREVVLDPKTSQEYKDVYKKFSGQMKRGFQLQEIRRIENYNLMKWYNVTKASIAAKHKKGDPNEKQLFHGTTTEVGKLIKEQGFDLRFSKFTGYYGAGIYFSPYSSYSDSYAVKDPVTELKYMFLARVLVGNEYICTQNNNSLRRPPPIPNSTTELYDSVYGKAEKHTIVYENDQAYPEYLIIYK